MTLSRVQGHAPEAGCRDELEVTESPVHQTSWARSLGGRVSIGAIALLVSVPVCLAWIWHSQGGADRTLTVPSQSKRSGTFYPTGAQWAGLTVEPVQQHVFRAELSTEGKIAIDEDRVTPIFCPYSGRIAKLLVKQGDAVVQGQPLFTVEATDMVQAQNEFIGAFTAVNKARSSLNLAQIVDKRQRVLYAGKAVPLKEVQNARAAFDAAESDMRSSEAALEAARNRLRMLGKSDEEIDHFQEKGIVDPATPAFAPISGTIVQRKAGPGQYIGTAASEPVFVIGDLSTVWLVAYVRESGATQVRRGQTISFTVPAFPGRTFTSKIAHVGTSIDPSTRRLMVRAVVDNAERLLKPEMFANATIFTGEPDKAVSVPRSAVIHEGDAARIWVVRDDKGIEFRRITVGLTDGKVIQVTDGLKVGERIITKGSMFIARPSAGV
jgi:membrane fusion protein, heavy metal efflux system